MMSVLELAVPAWQSGINKKLKELNNLHHIRHQTVNKIRLEKFEYCNVGANHSRFVKSPIFYLTRLPNTFHTKQTYSLFFEGELLYVCLATRGRGREGDAKITRF